MGAGQQAARVTDPVTHGLGMLGIIGGMLIGAVVGAILIVSLPVTAPALVVGLTAAAAVGAVAGGGLAGHQLVQGIQRACALPSPVTGIIGAVGSLNVRVGNLPAARVIMDMATPCNGLMSINHFPIPAPIAEGSQTIRINNLLAARVTSKLVCGASIKQGSLTVYYGGPTQRVLAVFDLESMMLSALGFLAKASLIAMGVIAFFLGGGLALLEFGAVLGGFLAVNYGLGVLGDNLGPGWKDILQGGFGLTALIGGAKLGPKALDDLTAPTNGEFTTLGTDADPIASPEGRALIAELRASDPGATEIVIYDRASQIMQSGTDTPIMRTARPGEQFFKLVPSGASPSETTPYFMSQSQLDALSQEPQSIPGTLGLPKSQDAASYDVYSVTSTSQNLDNQPLVFESQVAPTQEGAIQQGGGATQSILPNRSNFTSPLKVGSISRGGQ